MTTLCKVVNGSVLYILMRLFNGGQALNMNRILADIKEHKLLIIYRGLHSRECLRISRELLDAGVRLFEVTTNSPDAVEAISLLRTELGEEASVGAGTVVEVDQVDLVADAGASYIVSPNTNTEVIRRTKDLGLVSIPGAFTPSEIMTAWQTGADMVKVFPINVVGAKYVTQLGGPMSEIPLMATGGVQLDMVRDLMHAGCASIGIGVQHLDKDLLELEDWGALRAKATEWINAAKA